MHALGVQVVTENSAKLISLHFAHEGSAAAKRGKSSDRVCGGSSRHFNRGSYHVVKSGGLFGIDECHSAVRDFIFAQKIIRGVGDNIDQRIAYGTNIKSCRRHETPGSKIRHSVR